MGDNRAQIPLNILTIDGEGYQGTSNFLVLGDLMRAIKTPGGRPPKPCDVFDVICGVGSGGWIALLLGRFNLDIAQCYFEYNNITQTMARPNTTTSKWSRHVHDSIYDIKRLKAYANFLTKKYGTGANLLKTDKNVRCKQTIVVASYKAEPYLFRTYSVEGQDPVASISDAICAAGAKRGFLYPCVLRLGDGPAMKFGDETFANCLTNATPVALDEVTRIYGEGARISAVVNIGRGPEQLPWEGVSPNDDLSEPLRQGPFWRKPKHKCPDRKTERIPLLKHHPPPTARPHRHLLSLIGRKPPDLAEIHQRLKAQRASDHTKIVNQINSIDSGAKYTRLGPDDASRDFVINDVLGLWDDPARLALDEEIKAVAAYLDDREVINTIENLAEVLSR